MLYSDLIPSGVELNTFSTPSSGVQTQLSSMNVAELKTELDERGIVYKSRMKKQDLIKLLEE